MVTNLATQAAMASLSSPPPQVSGSERGVMFFFFSGIGRKIGPEKRWLSVVDMMNSTKLVSFGSAKPVEHPGTLSKCGCITLVSLYHTVSHVNLQTRFIEAC